MQEDYSKEFEAMEKQFADAAIEFEQLEAEMDRTLSEDLKKFNSGFEELEKELESFRI